MSPSFTSRQLGMLLRLGDERAVKIVWSALDHAGGNVTAAAQRLGLPRLATLHEWLRLPALAGAPRQGTELAGARARDRGLGVAGTRRKDAGSEKST